MFAIGWPRVLASAAAGADDPAVALEHDARTGATALVTPTSVEIWSCGRDRRCVGRHSRSPEAVLEEGAYLAAKWRDGRSSLAVIAEGGRVHLFDLVFADAPEAAPGARARRCELRRRAILRVGSPPPPKKRPPPAASGVPPSAFAASLAAPPLSPVKEDAAAANDGTCVSVAGDADVLILGTSTGHLVQCAWDWDGVAPGRGLISRTDRLAPAGAIVHLDFASPLGLLVAVVASGRCAALRAADHALERRTAASAGSVPVLAERIDRHAWLPGVEDAVLARVAPDVGGARRIAVGTRSGEVRLYAMRDDGGSERGDRNGAGSGDGSGAGSGDGSVTASVVASVSVPVPVFASVGTLGVADWGYTPRDTGPVSDARWTRDGGAIAVGWRRRGLAVWTPSGCRVMCTLRQGGGSAGDAEPRPARSSADGCEDADEDADEDDDDGCGGTSRLAWSSGCRRLVATSSTRGGGAREYEFAVSAPARRVDLDRGARAYLLVAPDGIVAVEPRANGGTMASRRLALPHAYAGPNWPLRLAAVGGASGEDVAVAGARGLLLHNLATGKSRVFGDVTQERAFVATALTWVGDVLAACVRVVDRDEDDGEDDDDDDEDDEDDGRGGRSSSASASSSGFGGGWFDWAAGADRRRGGGFSSAAEERPRGAGRGKGKGKGRGKHFLRVYPKDHLDASSVLAERALPAAPSATSASSGRYLVVVAPATEVTVYELVVRRRGGYAGSSFASAPGVSFASLAVVRRATLAAEPLGRVARRLMKSGAPVAAEALPATPPKPDASSPADGRDAALGRKPEPLPAPPPEHVMLLRAGGALSLVRLEDPSATKSKTDADHTTDSDWTAGREREVADGVEAFWIAAGGTAPPASAADTRWSWWTYGAEGVRVWYVPAGGPPVVPTPAHGGGGSGARPGGSSEAPGGKSADASSNASLAPAFSDPELEFDREAYPVGVSLWEGAAPVLIGVTQRLALASCASDPCFEPTPKAQPVLPCLLRHLLRVGESAAARRVARVSADKPGFAHALEWLLFAALDRHAGPGAPPRGSAARDAAERALADALELASTFPDHLDVVVSVARKTDSVQWPALFALAGDPAALCDEALARGQLRTAACYLLVVDKLAGAEAGAAAAAKLLRAALTTRRYALAGELARFLARPAVEDAAAEANAKAAAKRKRKEAAKRRAAAAADAAAGVGGFFRWIAGGGSSVDAEAEASEGAISSLDDSPDDESPDDESPALTTPRGARHVSGCAGGVLPVLPADLRECLRAHAARLAAAADVGALASFARELDFDLAHFFRDEIAAGRDGGAARLGDFPRALAAAAESLRRSGRSASARASVESLLSQTTAAGAVEWSLVVATATRRVDVLENIIAGREEVAKAWEEGVERCAAAATARGDDAAAAFFSSLRGELRGGERERRRTRGEDAETARNRGG